MENYKKFFAEMLKAVEKDVMGTMQCLAESEGVLDEDGKPECAPQDMLFFLKETIDHTSFVEMVANRAGFKLPLKYTRVPVKMMELYLTVHPEVADRDCRNFVYDFPQHPTPEQRDKASQGIRVGLEMVYHLQLSEENTLNRVKHPDEDELSELFAVWQAEELINLPDDDEESEA